MFLLDFTVLDPSFGLIFWTTLAFILVWAFLSRFFKSIANALEDRENYIDGSISKAKEAEAQLANLEKERDAILENARKERLAILKEGEDIKTKLVEEGRTRAGEEEQRILAEANLEKENRMKEMEVNIQNHIGKLSVEIASKLLAKELDGKHEDFVKAQVAEMAQ